MRWKFAVAGTLLVAGSALAQGYGSYGGGSASSSTGARGPADSAPLSRAEAFAASSPRLLDNPGTGEALGAALAGRGLAPPPGGMAAACAGFREIGQCVGAMRAGQALAASGGFAALRGLMTGSAHLRLGDAIHRLAPTLDAKAAAKSAQRQAADDFTAILGAH